jgi:hypothetical protein
MMENMMPVMMKGISPEEERNVFISQMISNLIQSLPKGDRERLFTEILQS